MFLWSILHPSWSATKVSIKMYMYHKFPNKGTRCLGKALGGVPITERKFSPASGFLLNEKSTSFLAEIWPKTSRNPDWGIYSTHFFNGNFINDANILFIYEWFQYFDHHTITNSDLNRPCFAWHPYGKSCLFKTELVIAQHHYFHDLYINIWFVTGLSCTYCEAQRGYFHDLYRDICILIQVYYMVSCRSILYVLWSRHHASTAWLFPWSLQGYMYSNTGLLYGLL